jgi:hypothetical protein
MIYIFHKESVWFSQWKRFVSTMQRLVSKMTAFDFQNDSNLFRQWQRFVWQWQHFVSTMTAFCFDNGNFLFRQWERFVSTMTAFCFDNESVLFRQWQRFVSTMTTFFLGRVSCRTNTVSVIWRISSSTGGGRPQVPICTVFKAQTGTWVEPPTFCMLVG